MNPELLTHGNIPKPLHGVNPRTIKGKEWWDYKRHQVYAAQDFKCAACGVHKYKAKYHRWLEAHENYTIDYLTGCVEIKDIVALCHSCHNFIHSGRLLALTDRGQITQEKFVDILRHGFNILKANNLKPFYHTALTWLIMVNGMSETEALTTLDERGIVPPFSLTNWSDWHLLFEGKKHYSPFADYDAWLSHYS